MYRMFRFKSVAGVMLALVLVAVAAVVPAAAQEPGADVGAAQSFHAGFCVNPNSNSVAGPACPAGAPQVVPSGGIASTEVTVRDVDNLGSIQIALDYNADVARIKDIHPGSIFDGLTQGVDYTIDKSKIGGFAAPLNPAEPAIGSVAACGGTCWRSYIFITIYNWATPKVPLSGNGSLIKIYWQVQPAPFGATSRVTFPILSMANKSGSSIWPCYPDTTPLPNPWCGPVSVPILAAPAAPDVNLLVGSPIVAGLQFQTALEGGKQPGDDDPNCNFPSPNPLNPLVLCMTDVTVVAGVFVDVADALGTVTIPYSPSYPTVTASRPGYLNARATNVLPGDDLGMVTLTAGDITGDNVVNIFDLTVVAGSLGAPVGTSTALEMMDFNADGVITIADLAIVAKNFGLQGPTPIRVIH
jgi:hypothetical protein